MTDKVVICARCTRELPGGIYNPELSRWETDGELWTCPGCITREEEQETFNADMEGLPVDEE